ncbi:hypothetical protein [Bacillus phage vB_BanS-Thrax1]|nr:hypothetical protein [Bacillus phage vB_BanS-Thrax1]
MIIIEGKEGKSKVLEDLVNNRLQNRNVVIIDTVGVRGMVVPKGVDHFICSRYSAESAIDIYKTGWFEDYEWIIFEINMDEEKFHYELGKFMDLDKNSTQNFIVTVQTQDEIKVRFA